MQTFTVFFAIVVSVGLISLALGWFSGRASGFAKALRVLERKQSSVSPYATLDSKPVERFVQAAPPVDVDTATQESSAPLEYQEHRDPKPVSVTHAALQPAHQATRDYLTATLPEEEVSSEAEAVPQRWRRPPTWPAELHQMLAFAPVLQDHCAALRSLIAAPDVRSTASSMRDGVSDPHLVGEPTALADMTSTLQTVVEQMKAATDQAVEIHQVGKSAEMLALNAAIEAARAGEAGRGFSVVATNMKTLAHTSQEAADKIKDLLANTQAQVDQLTAHLNIEGALPQDSTDPDSMISAPLASAMKEPESERLPGELAALLADLERILPLLKHVAKQVQESPRTGE